MVIFLNLKLCFLFNKLWNFPQRSVRTSHLVSTWTSMRPFSAAPRTWGAAVIGCCPRVPRAATVAWRWSQGESKSWWIEHQLIGGKHPIIYRVPTCFNHPRWCRISSIHSIYHWFDTAPLFSEKLRKAREDRGDHATKQRRTNPYHGFPTKGSWKCRHCRMQLEVALWICGVVLRSLHDKTSIGARSHHSEEVLGKSVAHLKQLIPGVVNVHTVFFVDLLRWLSTLEHDVLVWLQ